MISRFDDTKFGGQGLQRPQLPRPQLLVACDGWRFDCCGVAASYGVLNVKAVRLMKSSPRSERDMVFLVAISRSPSPNKPVESSSPHLCF